jgi:competence protein ComEC
MSPLCRQDRSSLVFVDVGQGDCLHIRTADGRNYLVDGGGSVDYEVGRKTLLPYLLKNGVGRLDGVFATHLHTDHWRGVCELSRDMDVGKVYVYEGNHVREDEIRMSKADAGKENAAGKDADFGVKNIATGGKENRYADGTDGLKIQVDSERMVFVAQGDRVILGEGVRLDVLWPPRHSEAEYISAAAEEAAGGGDENRNSLIMKFDYEGVTAMMTGDAGEEAERALIDEYGTGASGQAPASAPPGSGQANAQHSLYARILKVGHHGSKYSTTDDFLAAVRPDAAVIQVGKNNFGHPTADVLDKLRGDGIMIFRNDLGGAIMFTIRDGKVIRGTQNVEDGGARFQDN